jgi:hypothetical protein
MQSAVKRTELLLASACPTIRKAILTTDALENVPRMKSAAAIWLARETTAVKTPVREFVESMLSAVFAITFQLASVSPATKAIRSHSAEKFQ